MRTSILKQALISFYCFILILTPMQKAFAQELEEGTPISEIKLLTKSYNDSIVLRWAPSDATTWINMQKKGYHIVRFEIDSINFDTTLLTKSPLIPKSLDELKKTVDTTNKYIGIAAQAMYGKDFILSNEEPTNQFDMIKKSHDMFQMRFYFALQAADLSKEAADVLCLRYVDRNVEKGKTYIYGVLPDSLGKDNKEIKPGYTIIRNVSNFHEIIPKELNFFSGDKKIELQWSRNQIGNLTMFYIERSDDAGKTYKRLNEEPYFTSYDEEFESNEEFENYSKILRYNHVFIDSVPLNHKDYYYRIIGIDAFGDLTNPSEPLIAHSIDLTPPKPAVIEKIENIRENHVFLEWSLDEPIDKDLEGFWVQKSTNAEGPFFSVHENLLSAKTYKYTDTSADALQTNYYLIASVDSNKNISYSIPRMVVMIDTTPPSPPSNIEGISDSSGYVFLRWLHNSERDVKGYKVYRSYNKNGNFIQITNYPTTINGYVDSIDLYSLDREVYYKIIAVDYHNNHSDFSEAVQVRKQIVIPPTKPIIKKIYSSNFNIHLEIIGSRSEGVDFYNIYRKTNDAEWEKIAEVQKSLNILDFTFVDTTVISRTDYTYAVETVDYTGLASGKSDAFKTNIYKQRPLESIKEFNVTYDKNNNFVKLSWDYIQNENTYFVIYKAKDDGELEVWNSTRENSIIDHFAKEGKYTYAVKVVNEKTIEESPLSKQVSIDVKN